MMKSTVALCLMTLLAGCEGSNIPTRGYAEADRVAPPAPAAGASVRMIREAAARQKADPVPTGRDAFAVKDDRMTRMGFRTYILRDLEKGCEYIVVDSSMSASSVSILPRRHRAGGIITQRCIGAGTGAGYAWIGRSKDMIVTTVHDADMGCDFIAGQELRAEGLFMVERMYQRPDGTTAQVCDRDRELGS